MPRKKKRPKPASQPVAPRLPLGSRVRVRPGVLDPDYPDFPLGGYAGTVVDADDRGLLLVEWSEATLRQMHPTYRFRCERDGLELERSWLNESELEVDAGEPLPIEQPATLTPRPLDPGEQEDRIRAIFNLTSDEPLPAIDEERLAHYHRFLDKQLLFPLDAVHDVVFSFSPNKQERVQFVGLAPMEQVSVENGLLAEIVREGNHEMVELFDIEARNHYARQLIGDYSYWFCEVGDYAVAERGRLEVHPDGAETDREPSARRFVLVLVHSALLGALCGAVAGAIVAAVPGAAFGMMMATGVFAAAGCFLGSRLGVLLRMLKVTQKAPIVGSVFGTFAGAAIGAVVGPMLVAYVGTVLGSVAGYIVGRTLAVLGVKWPGGFLGGVLGVGTGGVALACVQDADKALIGLLSGALIGAVIGVALVLTFFLTLALFESRRNDSE